MNATKRNGLITFVGFDPQDNGKRWIEEKGNYTYVCKQKNEWNQSVVPIAAYDTKYLQIAKRHRYITPSYAVEKRIINGEIAYHFWLGKDYWFFDKNEAIKFIYDHFED